MIKNHFKIAFRSFKKHKLFTFINIIGLSIGVSAAIVIFLIVYHDFTFDKFHKDKERIYRVVSDYAYSGEQFYNSGVTGPLPDAVKNEVTLCMADDGAGFDTGTFARGHGLNNVKARARRIGAGLHISSAKGSGTTDRLIFNISKNIS